MSPDSSEPRLARGPGRVLTAVYGVFALAATARSVLQLLTKFGDAPLAYTLSAFAALTYVAALVGLVQNYHRLTRWIIGVELCGVIGVGTWSLLVPQHFPDATVWSQYGRGYGFVPLLLPLLAAWWLRSAWRATKRETHNEQ